MSEFNFFKPFIPVKKKTNYKKIFWLVLVIVLVTPVGYYHWNMLVQLNAINAEIRSVEGFLSDPAVLSKVEEVTKKQETVNEYLAIREELFNSKTQINSEFQVAAYLLDLINDQIPNELFLTRLSLSNGTLNIEGYCDSFETIAQYVYNLRMTGMFEKVEIPSVTKGETYIYFTVEGSIKWGGMNETE